MTQQITITFGNRQFLFETDSKLFSPNQLDPGTRLLLESAVLPADAKNIADIGCGWGAVGIILAKLHPDKFFCLIDNDPLAIETAKKNLQLNAIKNAKTFKADVTYSTLSRKFDAVLTNPPWTKNLSVNPSFVKFAHDHLNPEGIFAAVINKTFRLQDEMEKVFGNVDAVAEKSSYKILLSRKSLDERSDLLASTINVIKTQNISPNPLQSQYFLTDSRIIDNLVAAANLHKGDTVLEIGPGLGSITEKLSAKVGKVIAVEIDKQFAPVLRRLPKNVELIFADFFEVFKDRKTAPKFNKVLANLPFSSAGPIILKLKNYPFKIAVLVLPQKYGERMIADNFQRDLRVRKLFSISRAFFYPMPETDSVVVEMRRT